VSILEDEEYVLQAWANNPFRSKWSQWFQVAVGIMVGLGVSAYLGIRDFRKGDDLWWIAFPIGAAVCGMVLYWQSPAGQRRQVRASYRKHTKGVPTESWFEFSAEGFISTGQGGRTSFHPWQTVPRVVRTTRGLVIVFDPAAYFWIPSGAFENMADYDTLVLRIETKVKDFSRLNP
jgi:hypothetical protein